MRLSCVRGGMALVLCMTLVLSGCSTNWITQAQEIVTVLIPAAANTVTLVAALQGKSVSAADLQTIQNAGTQAGADLQLIQSLIAAYDKADAATKPGLLKQIESGIQAVQQNLQGVLPALHIKDTATQAKITAVVGLMLSEVQALAAIVPVIRGAEMAGKIPTSAAKSAAEMGHPRVVKAPLSAEEFVSSFNATLTAKTGNADLDRAAEGLKIHLHGKVERVMSLGVAK